MHDDDPAWLNPPPKPLPTPPEPEVSTHDTIVPRHLAASFDNALTFIASLVCSRAWPEEYIVAQVITFVAVYPCYFLVQEALFSRTIGKFAMGLMVTQYDGRRCTWRQALVRTAFRFLEVNPLVFGALPAAIAIISSQHRQRWGDKVARTLVVPARRAE